MNEYKDRGILLFSKISSENNLYLKILTEKDEIITGLSFGGSSKKKKNIYQIGYFLNVIIKNKKELFFCLQYWFIESFKIIDSII